MIPLIAYVIAAGLVVWGTGVWPWALVLGGIVGFLACIAAMFGAAHTPDQPGNSGIIIFQPLLCILSIVIGLILMGVL